jgi:hypothetical protein
MSPPNGRASNSVRRTDNVNKSVPADVPLGMSAVPQLTPQQIKELVALLEVPFDPSVIEWRVTNTSKRNEHLRGQVIPYADQRAYTDRLNALFSPAGWTRKYTVHTSANFQRSKDQKTIAKVFVTCDLTIFGLGSHAATGEEWTDDDNAGTSAEAQAFKRACSCFGLGRYLYHFTGTWVDLDERKRPKAGPQLVGWATPEGWRQGLRPCREADRQASEATRGANPPNGNHALQSGSVQFGKHSELVRLIQTMAEHLGRGLYRGLLKTVGRAWKPDDIKDAAVLQKLLAHMQAADRGLRRLDAAIEKTGSEPLAAILRSLNVKSLDQVDNLESLHKIVLAIEAKAGLAPQRP